MKHYKHYSFDLWGTLIRYNIKYEENIAAYIYNCYASSSFTFDQIYNIIHDIESKCIRYCDITGKHIDSYIMISMIFDRINWIPTLNDFGNVQFYFDRLCIEYTPYLFDEHTKHVLKTLKEKGVKLNILSNTGFITGDTIHEILKKLEIYQYFDFFIYSDRLGISKPNPEIFKNMIERATLEDFFSVSSANIQIQDILHVGDNPIADGGSAQVGVDYFQINTNNKTILDLL